MLLSACGGIEQGIEEPNPSATVCVAPKDIVITDINSLTDWINALPKPTSLPCFIESLPRPLDVNAAVSDFSAQPSKGAKSPRVFLFIDKLVLTVAMDHVPNAHLVDQSAPPKPDLLEIGFITSGLDPALSSQPVLTIKAEYEFPVLTNLAYSAPYTQIEFDDRITNCAFCHANEVLVDYVEGAPVYESDMIKPAPKSLVPLPYLRLEQTTCLNESESDTYRCDMFDALFSHGQVRAKNFPDNAVLF